MEELSLTAPPARDLLGAAVWLDPSDSPERVNHLLKMAAEAGLGWARFFIMWPFVEPRPGEWDFTLFDTAFDAAARHGVRVKATLTANNRPWHAGNPSLLHGHTGFYDAAHRRAAATYIDRVVERYRAHPGLGQWILWNEPIGHGDPGPERLEQWRAWLESEYAGNLAALNERWRTGYASFAEIPLAEEVARADFRSVLWASYRPMLDDARARADRLSEQVRWVAERVRALDPTTPTCVNPTTLLENHALEGVDLNALAGAVDVIGASYHPAWHFTFAPPAVFAALMVAGVRLQAGLPAARGVEVTELQFGNAIASGPRPAGLHPSGLHEHVLQRFILAGLAGGAQSVTGWALNTRGQDFEAGDWALIGDDDQPSARSRAVRRLSERLGALRARTGPWRAAPAEAWVILDPASEGLDAVDGHGLPEHESRHTHAAAYGAGLSAVLLAHLGLSATISSLAHLPPSVAPGALILALGLTAWTTADAERLLGLVNGGATLVLDATTGRKTPDAALHRPWPGGLGEALGLSVETLETNLNGFPVTWEGLDAGTLSLTRAHHRLSGPWSAWPQARFADGGPVILERPHGRGRVLVARALLGAGLGQNFANTSQFLRNVLRHALPQAPAVTLLAQPPSATLTPISVPQAGPDLEGRLWLALTEDRDARGQDLRLKLAPGAWQDLWTGLSVERDATGEAALPAEDGIAILARAGGAPG